jgi:acetoin utilization deacetylase AcuC-like enzyme
MISIFSADHALHDPPYELLDGALVPIYESPARAALIHAAIEQAALGPILPPRTFGLAPIRAIHSDDYLGYLETIYERWVAAGGAPAAVLPGPLAVRWMGRRCDHPAAAPGYYCFDMSAPIVAGTYRAARAAADAALTGAALLLEGQRAAYALCRPPGHHAERRIYGGFCFLNNSAIAANFLSRQGKVALLDIDYHHGNGAQDIFYARDDVLTVSIHGHPSHAYPNFSGYSDERGEGAGLGFNHNFPTEPPVDDERYLALLERALGVVRTFKPRFFVLSIGFDIMRGDPTGSFAVTNQGMHRIGKRIGRFGLPTLIVQEGGYSLGNLRSGSHAFFRGIVEAWHV